MKRNLSTKKRKENININKRDCEVPNLRVRFFHSPFVLNYPTSTCEKYSCNSGVSLHICSARLKLFFPEKTHL